MEPHVTEPCGSGDFTVRKSLENLVKHGVVHVPSTNEVPPEGQGDDLPIGHTCKE